MRALLVALLIAMAGCSGPETVPVDDVVPEPLSEEVNGTFQATAGWVYRTEGSGATGTFNAYSDGGFLVLDNVTRDGATLDAVITIDCSGCELVIHLQRNGQTTASYPGSNSPITIQETELIAGDYTFDAIPMGPLPVNVAANVAIQIQGSYSYQTEEVQEQPSGPYRPE